MAAMYGLCTLPDILCCWRSRNSGSVICVDKVCMTVFCRPQHSDTLQSLCSVRRYRDGRLLLVVVGLECYWIGGPSCHLNLISMPMAANWLGQMEFARDNGGQNYSYLPLSFRVHYLILVTDNACVRCRPEHSDTLQTLCWGQRYTDDRLLLLMVVLGSHWVGGPLCHLI